MFTFHLLGTVFTLNLKDPRVSVTLAVIWVAALIYLISYIGENRHRVPTENDEPTYVPDEADIEEAEIVEDHHRGAWGRLKDRVFGPDHPGATLKGPFFTEVAPRVGRLSADIDSLADRDWFHDELVKVQLRMEAGMADVMLRTARALFVVDEMVQILDATCVHIATSAEIDAAAAPLMEKMERCLDTDTAIWTPEDQAELERLLDDETARR